MRNITIERRLDIIRMLERSKQCDPDRDKRLVDSGSNVASIYDTPVPYLVGMFGDIGRFNPKRAVEFFHGGDAPTNQSTLGWHTWNVPKNASFVYMICGGSGAGGGGGFTAASGSAKGGGSGGGSGACARALYPAKMIPRVLYFLACVGGGGSTGSGVAGTAGGRSWIFDQDTASGSSADQFLVSGAANAGGGAAGAASGAAAVGTAETIATSNAVFMGLAIWQSVAGIAGTQGGNGATPTAGTNASWGSGTGNNALPWCGGTGGGASGTGNSPTAGGAINTSGLMGSLAGGVASAIGPGGNGQNGGSYFGGSSLIAFASNGGTGGGACATSGTGGTGGSGGNYCSGGGGGGAGVTGGPGGAGGIGFVYIACF